MKIVNVREAKTHLSRLLEAVEAGQEVVIARAGRPVARLMPLPVQPHHAARVRQLPPLHADPFDRLLLAQAQCEGAQLVTADRAVMAYPAPVRWIEDF